MNEPRYTLYFAPEDGTALARFGWRWLGRQPDSAVDAPFPPAVAADQRHAAIVAEPRRYGLHATLKPPFRLAEGAHLGNLMGEIDKFCASQRRLEIDPLELGELDGFLALQPSRASESLDALAADCVTRFDRFRAPATAEEFAKRAADGLTARQHELLRSWGYPYVLDQFRFHVTLTGRLDDGERSRIRSVLMPLIADVVTERTRIHSVCLFEQPGAGERFVLRARVPFAG